MSELPEAQESRMERIMKFLHTKKRKAPEYIKRYTSTPEIVSVEGNIGSGKTKILRHLFTTVNTGPRHRDIFVIYDTTSDADKIFTSEGPLIELFYGNKTKYGFMYIVAQITVYRSKIREIIRDCIDIKYIICERSITSIFILAQSLHHQGHLTRLEIQVIEELCKDPTLDFLNPKRSFYIDTNLTSCLERIKKRVEADRSSKRNQLQGEKRINLAYLAGYKRFLCESTLIRSAIRIDGDTTDRKERETIVPDILHQLQQRL
jgi:deoxyadenosine/deoxycytidine kinase